MPSEDAAHQEFVEWGGFSVKQDGVVVARGSGPYDACRLEAQHYAAIYSMDGPVTVRVWKNRRKIKVTQEKTQ